MVRRIFDWLAAEAHGDIFTFCLTQRVMPGETLAKARARMRPKERRFLDHLKGAGLLAGASVSHIVWSKYANGWHFHIHLLLEVEHGTWDVESLKELYRTTAYEEVQTNEGVCSLVVGAGAADPALGQEHPDLDFWSESSTALAKAVQYPVRDIAQGVTAEKLGGDSDRVAECVAVLLKHAKGWKLRRTFGRWRKAAPKIAPVVEKDDGSGKTAAAAAAPAAPTVRLGTVNRLAKAARLGDAKAQDVFRRVEASIRNNTEFGKRFVAFCRLCSGRGQT
jgi:hypothetical protein